MEVIHIVIYTPNYKKNKFYCYGSAIKIIEI